MNPISLNNNLLLLSLFSLCFFIQRKYNRREKNQGHILKKICRYEKGEEKKFFLQVLQFFRQLPLI